MVRIQNCLLSSLLVVVFLAACLVGAKNAAGFDWKSSTGGMCIASNGKYEKYLIHRHDGVINNSKKKLWVLCPIVIDEPDAGSLSGLGALIDQKSSDTTRCILKSSNTEGSVIYSSNKTRKGYGWISWANPKKYFHGMATLGCQLAPKARLFRIWYRESGTTDVD